MSVDESLQAQDSHMFKAGAAAHDGVLSSAFQGKVGWQAQGRRHALCLAPPLLFRKALISILHASKHPVNTSG